MTDKGWKTIVIQAPSALSSSYNCLHAEGEVTFDVPIEQIKILIIDSLQVSLTTYLLNELHSNGVKVIFCNQKHSPAMELLGYHDHYAQTGCIRSQFQWQENVKDSIWQNIVRNKIFMQRELLTKLKLQNTEKLNEYWLGVLPNDSSNREGQAARLYFHSLFGNDFRREEETPRNVLLNYGYSIILSAFNQKITASGYLTNFGIHHNNETNPYNLSCDFMEPFRPFVDEAVYFLPCTEINKEHKQALLNVLYRNVLYHGKTAELHTAIELFTEDILQALNSNTEMEGSISFP